MHVGHTTDEGIGPAVFSHHESLQLVVTSGRRKAH